ncbi:MULTISPECIES: DUF438 domain-containing protein [Thermococcus]|uniref:Sensory box protein n=1 Tax=Thermococcus sibiricus (strain DSM 12597 / MM 739) TaxID=604354 RepID=C6A595_THESM|nr:MULTISPECIES: DUF438 domain-containing protein [Thermococcus]ACS90790.1 Sensory box protein [Thermococcus sibiricus MM 739]MBC7094189.1 DUF438 domain-containing protein [Thermococcus sp.]
MTELLNNREYKKEQLKKLLLRIHGGEDVNKLKEEFRQVLSGISPLEIPIIEQELVKEGISARDIAKMCDLHVELFREAVKGTDELEERDLPDGHPLKTLYLENKEIMKDAEMLNLYARTLATTKDKRMRGEILGVLEELVNDLKKVGFTHYNREEMLIFPYIERRGLTAIATVLWTKHDEIRFMIKRLAELLRKKDEMSWEEFLERFKEKAGEAAFALSDMVFRENNIFYPTLKALLSKGEWKAIRQQEDEIGYYKVNPPAWDPGEDVKPLHPWEINPELSVEELLSLPKEVQQALKGQPLEFDKSELKREGDIDLGTGYISVEELKAIFEALPVDVTFIDKDDRVRFFSPGERIFSRTKSVLGRPVQLCHPPKSVQIVNKILKAFKEGRKSEATFWLRIGEKYIYIKYVPLFDKEGTYLGTLEITMDIAPYKQIEDEKRLLDWRD